MSLFIIDPLDDSWLSQRYDVSRNDKGLILLTLVYNRSIPTEFLLDLKP